MTDPRTSNQWGDFWRAADCLIPMALSGLVGIALFTVAYLCGF